jgi:hypothetical protein
MVKQTRIFWQQARLWLACAAIGVVVPIPLLALYVMLPIDGPEFLGPLVVCLACLFIGWCSSLVAGLNCRRIVGTTRFDMGCAFLANSSGWIGLLFLCYLLKMITSDRQIGLDSVIVFGYWVILSSVGFVITWSVMKPGGQETARKELDVADSAVEK